MPIRGVLQTGQLQCYDVSGKVVGCRGTGQDAEYRVGIEWPFNRFSILGEVAKDNLTGLMWTLDANPAQFPVSWVEAFEFIEDMNRETAFGFSDWRLPNRRELRSLMDYETRKPSLPKGHPFQNIFLGWYWTSTTAAINTSYAWYIHMEGARMFYGRKDQMYLVWPVRGRSEVLPHTGQKKCFDQEGNEIPCEGTGQDGDHRAGFPWPENRFSFHEDSVIDHLSGLRWMKRATLTDHTVSWDEAFLLIDELNRGTGKKKDFVWRLPNINELESLVDCSMADPALPPLHPFSDVKDVYWSSTTSFFEPDWAWALYLVKGATGVGVKRQKEFFVWPVTDA